MNNNITIRGRVGFTEARRFPTGKSLFKFSVAVYEFKKTTWFTCEAWNDLGDRALDQLAKGQSVMVSGRLDLQTYAARDGRQTMKAVIVVAEFALETTEPAAKPQTARKTRKQVA